MVELDALENAVRVELQPDCSRGILPRWDSIKPRHSNKRLAPPNSGANETRVSTILTIGKSDIAPTSVLRPIASVSETRFHRGFYRRMLPDRDLLRAEIDENAFQGFHTRVSSNLAEYIIGRKNLITGEGLKTERARGIRRGPHMVSIFSDSRSEENHRRVRNSEGRFHEPGPSFSKPEVHCESVLVGFTGARKRQRARSVGVWDNFSHTQEPLPALFGFLHDRRNQSQIVFG
jgi:hypothetical protein